VSDSDMQTPLGVAAALPRAMNAHDIEALVSLFSEEYDSSVQGRYTILYEVRHGSLSVVSMAGAPDFSLSGDLPWRCPLPPTDCPPSDPSVVLGIFRSAQGFARRAEGLSGRAVDSAIPG
jgi:hypothetical protein